MRRTSRGTRWLAVLLGAALLAGAVPLSAALAEGQTPDDGQADKTVVEQDETGGEAGQSPVEPRATDAVYVNADSGEDGNTGTADKPLATIQAALSAVSDGGTIYLQSDVTLGKYVFIDGKAVTIDGQGHTVTRASSFVGAVDGGRGGYNPAMIEVQNGAELTLRNITLDDLGKHVGSVFQEQPTSGDNKDNESKVQAAIIEASGDGHGSIILDSGAVLKNFGGMSAVRIGGQLGSGSSLTMKAGSVICDDSDTTHGTGKGGTDDTASPVGAVGAVWNQGGTFTMEEGAEIKDLSGRAIYSEDGGQTIVNGSISNIRSDVSERNGSWAVNQGFGGLVYFGTAGTTKLTLGPTGSISNIGDSDSKSGDVLFMLTHDATVETASGSRIENVQRVGILDANTAGIEINGTVENVHVGDVAFRFRGGNVKFELGESGKILNCSTDGTALVYRNGGKFDIDVLGEIDNFTGDVLFISNNNPVAGGEVTVAGKITNCTGTALLAGDHSLVTVSGEISNCGGYAINYGAQTGSLLKIESGAVISGNNNDGAQITVSRKDKSLTAKDMVQHAEIAPGTIQGNTTIDLSPFDVTLDADYASVKLGNASTEAGQALSDAVSTEHTDWKVIGTDAIWFQPSSDKIHFVASRPTGTQNTGIYAACVPLQEDGTPADDAEVTFTLASIKGDAIDVSLDGLTPGQSYALMFVNNNIYTLTPDPVTIYTGGGQGSETYDFGGWPVLTFNNSLDEIEAMTYDGQDVMPTEGGADTALDYIMGHLKVTYLDADGNEVDNDEAAGSYTVRLSWTNDDGFDPSKLLINGNNVATDCKDGTVIVRYVKDADKAESGESTYAVETSEPKTMRNHAVAVVDGDASFTLNGDASRPVTDVSGVSVLDDSLLTNTGDNRQELLEQKAIESGLLPELGAGQAYRFAFRYLDLVDAYNGNAWVANDGDTTIYLPYPDGMTYEEAQGYSFTLLHFKGLHREYGINGQAEVEEAIANSELEPIKVEPTEAGLKFTVPSSGFSPFAVVWQTKAHTVTATAGEGGSISPSGSVVVGEGADKTFVMTPDEGYKIADVKVDGQSIDLADVVAEDGTGSYTFSAIDADHSIDVTFRSTQHTITATAGEGGSISPSGAVSVADGADQAFTIAAADGYQIADVKVDGVSVGRVGSYTFDAVTGDHTIEATFEAASVTPPAHDHVWSDWKHDETSHWRVCEECGAVADRSDHVFGAWEQVGDGLWERTCTVCGYVQQGTTPTDDKTADDAAIPRTGDDTNTTLPGLLAVGGAAVVVAGLALRARRRRG